MANLDGTYDCVVKSPLGDQTMSTTITTNGDAFSGTSSGAMGSMDIAGTVSGNTLTWKQSISVPMPMTLDCEATIDGDTLVGSVGAGAFGSFPMTGKRTG